MLSLYLMASLALLGSTLSHQLVSAYQCQSEGFHVDPADCSKFYRCVDQWQNGRLTPFSFSCPGGK